MPEVKHSELLDFIGEDPLVQLIEDWRKKEPDAFLAAVSEDFDADDQEARDAKPSRVFQARYDEGTLFVRAELKVTYANPVDEYDRHLSAENITEHVMNFEFVDAHVLELDHSGAGGAADSVFPY